MEQDKGYQPRGDADNQTDFKKQWVPGNNSGNKGSRNKDSRLWNVYEGLVASDCQEEQVHNKPIGVEDPFGFETTIN